MVWKNSTEPRVGRHERGQSIQPTGRGRGGKAPRIEIGLGFLFGWGGGPPLEKKGRRGRLLCPGVSCRDRGGKNRLGQGVQGPCSEGLVRELIGSGKGEEKRELKNRRPNRRGGGKYRRAE